MVDTEIAKMPAERIAKALAVEPGEVKAWAAWLAATRFMPMPGRLWHQRRTLVLQSTAGHGPASVCDLAS